MATNENEPRTGEESTPTVKVNESGEGIISVTQQQGDSLDDTTRAAAIEAVLRTGRPVVASLRSPNVIYGDEVAPLAEQPGVSVEDSGIGGINASTEQPIGFGTPTGMSAIMEAFRTGKTVSVNRRPVSSGPTEQAAQPKPPVQNGGK